MHLYASLIVPLFPIAFGLGVHPALSCSFLDGGRDMATNMARKAPAFVQLLAGAVLPVKAAS